eukprot:3166788-Pleurochrysis_carterae.AAC.1
MAHMRGKGRLVRGCVRACAGAWVRVRACVRAFVRACVCKGSEWLRIFKGMRKSRVCACIARLRATSRALAR